MFPVHWTTVYLTRSHLRLTRRTWEARGANPRDATVRHALHALLQSADAPLAHLPRTDSPPSLRRLRRLAGLTQRQLNTQLQVSPTTIYAWERHGLLWLQHAIRYPVHSGC